MTNTNSRHRADALALYARASSALGAGLVDGECRLHCAAADGVLHRCTIEYVGRWEVVPTVYFELPSIANAANVAAGRWGIEQLVELLTKPGFFGGGTLHVSGKGGVLFPPRAVLDPRTLPIEPPPAECGRRLVAAV